METERYERMNECECPFCSARTRSILSKISLLWGCIFASLSMAFLVLTISQNVGQLPAIMADTLFFVCFALFVLTSLITCVCVWYD